MATSHVVLPLWGIGYCQQIHVNGSLEYIFLHSLFDHTIALLLLVALEEL